jgi:hypothetical protein
MDTRNTFSSYLILGFVQEPHSYIKTHLWRLKSKLLYDWRSVSQSVSQYVLVSSSLVGLATRYYVLSECCCLKFAVLFLWGTLSDEKTGLQSWSYFRTDSQSISMSWCQAPLWGPWPDFTFSFLLLENCFALCLGVPSLMRGKVCNL